MPKAKRPLATNHNLGDWRRGRGNRIITHQQAQNWKALEKMLGKTRKESNKGTRKRKGFINHSKLISLQIKSKRRCTETREHSEKTDQEIQVEHIQIANNNSEITHRKIHFRNTNKKIQV